MGMVIRRLGGHDVMMECLVTFEAEAFVNYL